MVSLSCATCGIIEAGTTVGSDADLILAALSPVPAGAAAGTATAGLGGAPAAPANGITPGSATAPGATDTLDSGFAIPALGAYAASGCGALGAAVRATGPDRACEYGATASGSAGIPPDAEEAAAA